MPIPKIIYQTWKTKNLHENCLQIKKNIQDLNPEYEMILYDDDDMKQFIKQNFDEYIYNCYLKLNIGAAKADFWRYCILYKNGGVYLDMDSIISHPLNELILEDDACIITREGNKGIFNNWIMMFEKNHPILLKTINNCCYNIMNKTTNDIVFLTGPQGPFTNAINEIMIPLYTKK
jgi:mannosyltransferase OCH1-like enzyme